MRTATFLRNRTALWAQYTPVHAIRSAFLCRFRSVGRLFNGRLRVGSGKERSLLFFVVVVERERDRVFDRCRCEVYDFTRFDESET